MKDCVHYTWGHEKNTAIGIIVQWWKVHIFIYKKVDQGIICFLESFKWLMASSFQCSTINFKINFVSVLDRSLQRIYAHIV